MYKQETIRNQFINIYISYWKFGNNRSINWLFGESAQHYSSPHMNLKLLVSYIVYRTQSY